MTSISRDRGVVGPLVPSYLHARACDQEKIPPFLTSSPLRPASDLLWLPSNVKRTTVNEF